MTFKRQTANCNIMGDTTLGLRYTDLVHSPSTITSLYYLGIYLDHHLSWDNHINIMANCTCSTIRGINILGNMQCSLDLLNWCKVYNTLVIPVLTYGAQVWYMKRSNICAATRLTRFLA